MNPQVYEFALPGAAGTLFDIYHPVVALKSTALYAVAAVIGAGLLAWTVDREHRGLPVPPPAQWPLLPASFLLFAIFTLTWGHVDEVSVNLEHAYNLYHFGRFSFSPAAMLDGTVEYAYYLLLTPFAWSPASLVTANFILGFAIAWAHLWLLSRLVRNERRSTALCLLLLFSVNYPLVATLSSGFGNGLVSLACLASLSLQFAGRTTWAAVLASALPLLRPDGVLYSYAVLFAYLAVDRANLTWSKISRLAWPLCAVAAYLVLFRVAYGHWIPTPIAFKSVYPAMVTLAAVTNAAVSMVVELSMPLQVVALLAVLFSATFKDDSRLRVIRWLLLPMTAVFLFYSLTRSVLGDFSGDTYSRYWIGFTQTLFLCAFYVLLKAAPLLQARGWYLTVFGRVVPIVLVALTVNAILWNSERTNPSVRRSALRNRSDLGYAGQIASAVIPDTLTIATSELSTFGLMLDRNVVDLWGYTNPSIAGSRMLNASRVRNNPEFFLSAKPDIFFAYREPVGAAEAEDYLATFHHVVKDVNLLGDMNEVLASYDVVLVMHPQRRLFLLVRREAVATLRESLERHAYAVTAQRPLDMVKFRDLYARQPLTQIRF
jgi:hypothetical protein